MLDVIIEIDLPYTQEVDSPDLAAFPRIRCINTQFCDVPMCITMILILFLYFYVAAYQRLHLEMEYL